MNPATFADTWEAIDPSRLIDVQAELYRQLSIEDRERAAQAEPGSTRLHPGPDGWWHLTVGLADRVDLGEFHISVLRKDTNAGSGN